MIIKASVADGAAARVLLLARIRQIRATVSPSLTDRTRVGCGRTIKTSSLPSRLVTSKTVNRSTGQLAIGAKECHL
jgi:hypothetical protein